MSGYSVTFPVANPLQGRAKLTQSCRRAGAVCSAAIANVRCRDHLIFRWRRTAGARTLLRSALRGSMDALINVVVPVFGIILTGYLAGRLGVLGPDSAAALNRFVFYFALPPALLIFMARAPIDKIFNWPFIGARSEERRVWKDFWLRGF